MSKADFDDEVKVVSIIRHVEAYFRRALPVVRAYSLGGIKATLVRVAEVVNGRW